MTAVQRPICALGRPGWLAGLRPQDAENPGRQGGGQGDPPGEPKGRQTEQGWLLEFAGVAMQGCLCTQESPAIKGG